MSENSGRMSKPRFHKTFLLLDKKSPSWFHCQLIIYFNSKQTIFLGILQHAPIDCSIHGRVHRTNCSLVQAVSLLLQEPKHSCRGKCTI